MIGAALLARWRDRHVTAQIRTAAADGVLEQYGNTLPRAVNEGYMAYWRACGASGAASLPILRGESFVQVRSAISPSLAARLSGEMSKAIAAGEDVVVQPKTRAFMVGLAKPISRLGAELLSLFDGAVGASLARQYGTGFRILWCDCYRASPAAAPSASWLWHFDNVPLPALKVILYLTGTRDTGATTRIADYRTSLRLKQAGHLGLCSGDRVADLQSFAAPRAIPLAIGAPEMEAGDALVFHTNCFHQAALPARGHRDALTFFVLPARGPWRAHLQDGKPESIERLQGGFPYDPALLDRWGLSAT